MNAVEVLMFGSGVAFASSWELYCFYQYTSKWSLIDLSWRDISGSRQSGTLMDNVMYNPIQKQNRKEVAGEGPNSFLKSVVHTSRSVVPTFFLLFSFTFLFEDFY